MSRLPFPAGVVHLHLTTRCNLACSHCYSSSSPQASTELAVGEVAAAIEELAGAGFTHLSVSGGEPVIFDGLDSVVEAARRCAMSTSVVTNGLLGTRTAFTRLSLFDTVAVSLDGLEQSHDQMRNRRGSFRSAVRTIERLVESGQSVAIVSCVTEASLPELPDLWELGKELGVPLLQVRPLVAVGRASDLAVSNAALQPPNITRLGLTAALLERIDAGPSIQCDLEARTPLLAAIDALTDRLGSGDATPAEVLSPLVVREDGNITAYAYNIVDLELGTIGDTTPAKLCDALERKRAFLVELHSRVRDHVEHGTCDFYDWFDLLVRESG